MSSILESSTKMLREWFPVIVRKTTNCINYIRTILNRNISENYFQIYEQRYNANFIIGKNKFKTFTTRWTIF